MSQDFSDDEWAPQEGKHEPKVLEKKLKKVAKMLDAIEEEHGTDCFARKDYRRLLKKQERYETELKEFQNTMKEQFKNNVRIVGVEAANRDDQEDRRKSLYLTTDSSTGRHKRTTEKRGKGKRKKTKAVRAPKLQGLSSAFQPQVFEKSASESELLYRVVKKSFVFSSIHANEKALNELVKAFEPTETYSSGEAIITEGEDGDYFYVIREGSVEYQVQGESVGSAGVGAYFGELSLLYKVPRNATVLASTSATRLWRVDQVTFRYILQSRSKFINAIHKVIYMNRMFKKTPTTVTAVAEKFSTGSSHSASDQKEAGDKSKDELLDDQKGIPAEEADEAYLKRYSEERASLRQSVASHRPSLDDFEQNSILGEGQFGQVLSVSFRSEENLKDREFALKIQSKGDLFRDADKKTLDEAIERECKVLSDLMHPGIVEFVHQFQDEKNYYLVMGVIKGVELWNVIHQEDPNTGDWHSGIPEEDAKFYALIMADTLNYMHRRKIVHRDVKPENCMVDRESGYPIFVDFGFAKYIPDGTTYTFCGTVNYTSPEIIQNQGHGFAADRWALGIVIYEMIQGENPFYYDGISDLQLLEDIVTAPPLELTDDRGSDEAKSIVTKLLAKDPKKRLGSGSDDSDNIVFHPWFNGIDLVLAQQRRFPAPVLHES